ncbi:hypothetical protein FQA39_LY05899 [Lamprigera yunnana]|nr:hypothetical protein FQA39_LY05899 [Lamprigera yunnana]
MLLPKISVLNPINKNQCSVLCGTLAFTSGLIIIFLKSWFFEIITASVIVLRPNSFLESVWRKTPIQVPTSLYLFNWTNPKDIHNFNIKPKFEEVGPYVFNQDLEKSDIVWNDNNDTVTYTQHRKFSYDVQNPNGNLSDEITSINVISMLTSHYIRRWNYFVKRAASVIISTAYPDVHLKRTANQLLLDGYEDLIVNIANYLPFLASEIPRFDKFGWLFIINGRTDFEGSMNMETGRNGTFNVRQWNYNSSIPQFEGSCSNLHGSSGELYPHKISKDYISVFIPQICRIIKFEYAENVLIDGILGYKYVIGEETLDNGTKIPENECYCAGQCIPSGVFNISSCKYGLPAYGSLPHFYTADPFYLDGIDGLKPNKSKHESFIVLEPNTGITLKTVLRIQINILLHPIEGITVFRDVPKIFIPLVWAEIKGDFPANLKILLKIYLMCPHILLAIAIGLILVGLYLVIFKTYKPAFVKLYKQLHKRKISTFAVYEEVPLQVDTDNLFSNEKYECT